MNSQKVAVIIPIYNVEECLEECLESVVNQSYKNLEIILINDGSTDSNSFRIAKEYTSKDTRITLLEKENGGLSSARNAGLEFLNSKLKTQLQKEENDLYVFNVKENALKIQKVYKSKKAFCSKNDTKNMLFTEENSSISLLKKQDEFKKHLSGIEAPNIDYVCFVDSDDYIALECVSECLSKIQNCDFCWFDWQEFENCKTQEKLFLKNWTLFDAYAYKKEKLVTQKEWVQKSLDINQTTFWCVWGTFIKWDFLQKIQLRFHNGIIHEDNLFGTLLFSQAQSFFVIPKKYYFYRIGRAGSITSKATFVSVPPHLEVLYRIFEKNNVLMKSYNRNASITLIAFELLRFIQQSNDENLKKLYFSLFLPSYLNMSAELFTCKQDPFGAKEKWFFLEKFLEENLILGACKAVKKHLCYQIGAILLQNKHWTRKFFLLVKAYILFKMRKKRDIKPLSCYKDYKQALELQDSFQYCLGKAFVKALKKKNIKLILKELAMIKKQLKPK